ncbi:hypothetical protein [Streptomyces sp. VMFN-G11Ma]|uniref:hypothetical protein n=1 Tax=Streptomyces sp. VMFN-G11Ma TaxID=2135609 RepID=UPI000D34845F|nr:hypothetical protein [Streptomyces sp. VMFN-G11Ma]PTM92369.1 hypothetical protein C7821_109190 [Streptomyces sp. VMFN-G11Ma]
MTTQTPGGRGRHRRPRPRKVLFAVGGLALAAGALSLVRLAPESVLGGPGSAEAEPRHDPGAETDRAGNTAATVGTLPEVSPSATSALGGRSATPTPDTSTAPVPPTTTPPAAPSTTDTTTIPEAPNTRNAPPPTTAPHPPATTPPAPHPTPPPDRTTPPPHTADPTAPADPTLCVPVISLCVGLLGDGGN